MNDDLLPAQATLDTCHYTLHFPLSYTPSTLSSLLPDLHAFIATLSSAYIWHKQSFNLALSPVAFTSTSGAQPPQLLEGRTDCTDCVDDEWFIVWLLREVTRAWPEVVCSVEDEDGEFLLIEGADHLPRWVTPQNATNRVWIHQEKLHLVPLDYKSELPFQAEASNPSFEPEEEGFIDRLTALDLVRDSTVDTLAPPELESVVWARINGYPNKIKEHHHHTLTYLPLDIALALSDSPSLASEAISTFYERDPPTLRACSTMTRFQPASPSTAFAPSTSSKDLPPTVEVLTRLTRPLYSQLVLQKFFAPKPFEKVKWMEGAADEEERRRSVGMKIACGFEMLYKLSSSQVRTPTNFDPTEPKYQAFLSKLTTRGYFGEEIQGSAEWTKRERIARDGWLSSRVDSKSASFAQRVDEAIARALASSDPLPTRVLSALSPSESLALEDSEDWLSLDEEGFESMLQSRGPGAGGLGDLSDDEEDTDSDDEEEDGMEGVEVEGDAEKRKEKETERKEERKASRIAKQLAGMAGKVEEFIHGRGAVDGAEFSDEQSSDDDDDEEDEEPTPLTEEERAIRLAALVAPLPATEWGASTVPTTQPAPSVAPLDDDAIEIDSADPPAPPLLPNTPSVALPLPPRAPKLTQNIYDGASSDSDSDSDAEGRGEAGLGEMDEDGEEDEEAPAVVEEVDMGEEMDEFLKFATETLGLSEEQYGRIIGERKLRGAFVPPPSKAKTAPVSTPSDPTASTSLPRKPILKPSRPTTAPPVVPQPLRNPNLTEFDALMEKMDAELAQQRASRAPSSSSSSKPTPKPKSTRAPKPSEKIVIDSDSSDDEDAGDQDEAMKAMDAELAELFKKTNGGNMQGGEAEPVDYNLVKNFLESFQSQGGFGGPAGNMVGRLGFSLPRDETR